MDYDELKEKWSPQTNIQVEKKKRRYWLLLIVIPIIIFVIYLFLLFKYIVTITNERNHTLFGNLTIKDEKGNIIFQGYDHKFEVSLWKGNYQGIVSLTGYQNDEFKISNPVGLKFNYDIVQTALMKPKFINLSSFVFLDPTQTLTLSPLLNINGTNILQDNVSTTLNHSSSLIYGFYNVKIYTDNFYNNGTIEGDKLLVNKNLYRKQL